MKSRQSFHSCVETLGKCLDDAGTEPGFGLGKDAVLLANSIISNRKLPISPIDFILDDNLSLCVRLGKCVFQGIHDEFSCDQTNTFSLTRIQSAAIANHLQGDRPSVPNHRGCEGVTQPREI